MEQILPEKLMVAQLIKEFDNLNIAQKFIPLYTGPHKQNHKNPNLQILSTK